MSDDLRCACGQAMPDPLTRVGDRRALCACGQPTRLDAAAQAAYAERAQEQPTSTTTAPGTPRAAAPEPAVTGPERAPAPAGGTEPTAPAGTSSWSDAELSAEAQLPAEPEPQVEPDLVPAMPKVNDLGGWLAG